MKKLLSAIFILLLTHTLANAQELEAQSAPLRINLVRDTEAPKVFIVYHNEGRANSNGKVPVELRVLDGSGIRSVSINGRERMDGTVRDSVGFYGEYYKEDEITVTA